MLHRDVFNRLNAYRRENGIPDWDQAIERLLAAAQTPENSAFPL
jgi:hypothetical protein